MYVAYAYAMLAECIGRGGMIYLLSTAAQSFAEYEVWHVEGAWLFLIVSGMTIDVGWISSDLNFFCMFALGGDFIGIAHRFARRMVGCESVSCNETDVVWYLETRIRWRVHEYRTLMIRSMYDCLYLG